MKTEQFEKGKEIREKIEQYKNIIRNMEYFNVNNIIYDLRLVNKDLSTLFLDKIRETLRKEISELEIEFNKL